MEWHFVEDESSCLRMHILGMVPLLDFKPWGEGFFFTSSVWAKPDATAWLWNVPQGHCLFSGNEVNDFFFAIGSAIMCYHISKGQGSIDHGQKPLNHKPKQTFPFLKWIAPAICYSNKHWETCFGNVTLANVTLNEAWTCLCTGVCFLLLLEIFLYVEHARDRKLTQ